jgi:hypothetical protein
VFRLRVFLGRWSTRGRTTDGTDVAVRAHDAYEWLPGGHFLVHRWRGRVGKTDVAGLEVVGWDRSDRAYRTRFFDAEGETGTQGLTVRGRRWTWVGGDAAAGWHRCVAVVAPGGKTIRARHETSRDGRAWRPWMDVELVRVSPTARPSLRRLAAPTAPAGRRRR